MRAIINRSTIDGVVKPPPSKSYTHRAIVCGLLSKEYTRITNPLISDDTLATVNASRMMGATVHLGDVLEIQGPEELHAPTSDVDCQGSGTTLRIFTALAALTSGKCVLTGNSALQTRPVGDLLVALKQLGINAHSLLRNGNPPLIVQGRGLHGGITRIRGDVTSQYITGLLFACSKATGNTKIEITTRLESRPYVEMTLEVMSQFGVGAAPSERWDQIAVPGSQEYLCPEYFVEADYSSAAFLLAAGALAGRAEVKDIGTDSMQGDVGVVEFLRQMGVPVILGQDSITVNKSVNRAIDIDASDTPDLVPVLAVLATQAKGVTTIREASRLRLKESDRISAISKELRKMGASIRESLDGLIVKGPTPLKGAVLDPHDDHRIAMAGVIAGLIADGITVMESIECVGKSYPEFIQNMQMIGAQIAVEKNDGADIE